MENNIPKLWISLCATYDFRTEDTLNIWDIVESLYSSPDRHYHVLDHPLEMIEVAEELDFCNYAQDYNSVLFACIFHDVIYNTKRHDNERISAQLMNSLLSHLMFNQTDGVTIFEAEALIHATIQHRPKPNTDEELIVDLDLMRLGCDWDQFVINNDNIRKEYFWVPDDIFALERPKVFKHFLEMDSIFHLPIMQERFEGKAKENLEKALDTLC